MNFSKIERAIEDVSSLEVTTLTNPGMGVLDLSQTETKDIFGAIRATLTQAELVAYTRFELEGDSVNFISQKTEMQPLIEKHTLLVASSLATRKALFESILAAIKKI